VLGSTRRKIAGMTPSRDIGEADAARGNDRGLQGRERPSQYHETHDRTPGAAAAGYDARGRCRRGSATHPASATAEDRKTVTE